MNYHIKDILQRKLFETNIEYFERKTLYEKTEKNMTKIILPEHEETEQLTIAQAKEFEIGDKIGNQKIISVRANIKTSFGEKTLVEFENKKGMFANQFSLKNLVEGFTDETDNWVNKMVRIEVEMYKNNNMFVMYPEKQETTTKKTKKEL